MKRIFRLGLMTFLLSLGQASIAGPLAPYVPGELLIKVRVPVVSRNKSNGTSYSIPPVLRKKIEAEGMLSEAALGGRVDQVSFKSTQGGNESALKGLFLAKFAVDAPIKDLAEKISAIPGVEYAEPNYIGSLCAAPNDPFYASKQKPVYDRIGLEQAWSVTTGSPDTLVAVLDSGIDATHPDFTDRVLPGYNFVDDSADTTDHLGHGTRVAGIIGARGDDGVGMTGVCWDCRILPVVVAQRNGEIATDTLVQAIEFAWRQGADVINMSLAVEGKSKALEAECNIASNHAILVAAAGNEGQNLVERYPAAFESVLSVGAVDENGNRASFSNYNLPGVNEFVDLVAPGTDIFSSIPGNKYDGANGKGTSFSAPIVAGVAALLRSKYPTQSTGAIRSHLESNTDPLGSFVKKGLVDTAKALSNPLKPILKVAGVTIRDGTPLNASNDADSALDGGEAAEIVVELENEGADLDAFTASLSTSAGDVTIATPTAQLPALVNGKKAKNLAQPFGVHVAPHAPQSEATFTLHIPGAEDVPFTLPIENEAPVPQNIDSDLTLGPTHTWIVSGLTTVATGATLSAQPGTTVKFEERARLEVWGGLSSVGTSENPIRWGNKTPPPESLFAPSRTYPVGGSPQKVIAVDVTGDGIADVVTANLFESDVSVLEGDGIGGFAPGRRYPVGEWPTDLAFGDVTGDGRLDIITANSGPYNMGNTISVLAADGQGGFLQEKRYIVGAGPVSIAVSDLNSDGLNDIVTANYSTDDVSVLMGADDGTLSPEARISVGHNPVDLSLGDLTQDGFTDIIVANNGSDDMSVLVGSGRGEFTEETRYYAVGVENVQLADMDQDGFIDIITSLSVQIYSTFDSIVEIQFTTDMGGISYILDVPVAINPSDLVISDVNADGILDIVVVSPGQNKLSVVLGLGGRTFAHHVDYSVGRYPVSVVVGEANGDGLPDLICANNYDGDVSILLGGTRSHFSATEPLPPWPPGVDGHTIALEDLNSDGLLDIIQAEYSFDGRIRLLLGGSGGRFSSEVFLKLGESFAGYTYAATPVWNLHLSDYSHAIVLSPNIDTADITGDGHADFVYTTSDGGTQVLLSDGIGGFTLGSQIDGVDVDHPYVTKLVDITGDRILDLVILNDSISMDVTILKGRGGGAFSQPRQLWFGGIQGKRLLAVADLIGDGLPDIIVGDLGGGVTVAPNTGGGWFSQYHTYPLGRALGDIGAEDFSGDSIPDLIITMENEVAIMQGDGQGKFYPPIRFLTGSGLRELLVGDMTMDGKSDIVLGNSLLFGTGVGSFGPLSSIFTHTSGSINFRNSAFSLRGSALLQGNGQVSGCSFYDCGGSGIDVDGNISVRDSIADNCLSGFFISKRSPIPLGLSAINSRGSGIIAPGATTCVVMENTLQGLWCFGNADRCHSDLNNGIGILALGDVSDSICTRNTSDGISARVVENCLASSNSGTGIVASERVEGCTAIANANGIDAPEIINSLIIDSFGSGLASAGSVDGSRIVRNQSLHSFGVRFKDTVLDGNSGEEQLKEVSNMYIAGNEGGGVKGVPVSFSTIVGNYGPGIADCTEVIGCNIAFNEGAGVRDSSVSSSYLRGNKGGDAVNSSVSFRQNEPVGEAPPFLMVVSPTEEYPLGIGSWGFEFTFSADMNTSKQPDVSFGQSFPYTLYILSASPGWEDSRTWRGAFTITNDIPDGTYTFRVARAISLDGFLIPPDTYHQFSVDKQGGLQLSNGRVIAHSTDGLTIAWDPSESGDIVGYSVLRSRLSAGPYSLADSTVGSATQFKDTGLEPDTRYYYMVYEYDSSLNKRQLSSPIVGQTDHDTGPTRTPTPTKTPTPSATETEVSTPSASPSPTEVATPSPTTDFDMWPPGGDGHIDARDLLEMLKALGDDANALFDFARFWKD
jgi:subtilisin family serine protease